VKEFSFTLILGYLLGSIPFGLLLTRAAGLGDVRNIGSGNIGATNVLRTGNKGLAAATLVLDGLKGTAAVFIAEYFFIYRAWGSLTPDVTDNSYILAGIVAGVGAFLGHLFPIWLGFKGGKGVATFIGVVSALAWPLGLLFCLAWLAVAAATRFSSLAALAATLVAVAAAFVGSVGSPGSGIVLAYPSTVIAPPLALMAILLFYKHRENISRLLAGTESRIGAKG
jgi:acyl phosphate:glycerol-3-phosphate acyltransferase